MANDLMEITAEFPRLADKYTEKLQLFEENRNKLEEFVTGKLQDEIDYGKTSTDAKRKTLMKAGSDKIIRLMDCKVILYPDFSTAKMMNLPGTVFLSAYVIDQEIVKMITHVCMQKGFESIESIVKLFAWGEGKGAYQNDELCYRESGKPLKGSANRAVKMAEKRARVDAVISTFGLEFNQDEDYGAFGKLKTDQSGTAQGDKKPELDPEIEKKTIAARDISGYLAYYHLGEPAFSKEMKADIQKQVNLLKHEKTAAPLVEYVDVVFQIKESSIKKIDSNQGE